MLEWQGKERKESPMPVSKEKVNGVCPYLILKAPSSRRMVYKKESSADKYLPRLSHCVLCRPSAAWVLFT